MSKKQFPRILYCYNIVGVVTIQTRDASEVFAHQGFWIPSEVFFGSLTGALVVGVLTLVALTGWQLVTTWRDAPREKLVNKLALQVNMTVSDEIREALTDQVAARERGRLVGNIVALLALLALSPAATAGVADLGLAAAPIAVGLCFAGIQLGVFIGGAMGRRTVATNASVARLQPLGLADYVHPLERRMALVAAILAVSIPTLALVALSVLGGSRLAEVTVGGPVLAVTGLAVGAVYLGLPAIARRLSARRILRGGTDALAWSDALTGRALSDLHWLIAFWGGLVGFTSLQTVGLALSTGAPDHAAVSINVVSYIALGTVLATILIVVMRSPERHVERTLWPELAIVAE